MRINPIDAIKNPNILIDKMLIFILFIDETISKDDPIN